MFGMRCCRNFAFNLPNFVRYRYGGRSVLVREEGAQCALCGYWGRPLTVDRHNCLDEITCADRGQAASILTITNGCKRTLARMKMVQIFFYVPKHGHTQFPCKKMRGKGVCAHLRAAHSDELLSKLLQPKFCLQFFLLDFRLSVLWCSGKRIGFCVFGCKTGRSEKIADIGRDEWQWCNSTSYVAPFGGEVRRNKEAPQVLDSPFPTCRLHCHEQTTNEKRSGF